MKICHLVRQSWPDVCGSVSRLNNILACQKENGLDVFVISVPFQKEAVKGCVKEEYKGVTYYRTSSGKGDDTKHRRSIFERVTRLFSIFSFIAKANNICKKEKPDIIHAHATFFVGIVGLVVGLINRLPVVYEMRSTWEEDLQGKFLINFQRKIIKKLEEYTARLSKGVVFVSAGIKSHYNLKDLKNENAVIYNSVVEIDGVVKKEVGDVFHFGYVGSLAYYEGLDGIIPAARKLIDEYGVSNFKVFIYGAGSEFEPIKKLVKDNDLVDYIILKGRVDFEDMAAVYNNIDVILLPRKSLLITNMVAGLKPLEAFANRKLVLASDVGGMKELYTHGEHGFFFEADKPEKLAESMVDIMKNYVSKQCVIPTAFDYYKEKYSSKAMYNQYIKIYNSICLF